jgi:hypothetical protein
MRRVVAAAVVLVIVGLGAASAEVKCPKDLKKRHADQVVTDLRAALAAEDWELVGCHYAPEAFIIDDQGVLTGVDEIVANLMVIEDLFGGNPPVIHEQLPFNNVVRVLYTRDAGWFVIPDGTDSYVIRKGRIEIQTRHGVIEFTGPPPEED